MRLILERNEIFNTGQNQCECKIPVLPASMPFKPAVYRPDRFKICSDACRFYFVTLRGCSRCPIEDHEEHFERNFNPQPINNLQRPSLHLSPTPPLPFSHQKPQSVFPHRPVPQNAIRFENPQTVMDSTTPNWNRLCAELCRNGTGGLLCNCDLPPF